MSERAHDPIADPLTPYWREKVERAARIVAPQPSRQLFRLPRVLTLTTFERDVLAAIALGLTCAEIARARGVCRQSIYAGRDAGLRKLRSGGAP